MASIDHFDDGGGSIGYRGANTLSDSLTPGAHTVTVQVFTATGATDTLTNRLLTVTQIGQ